jgi:hypothetical protein
MSNGKFFISKRSDESLTNLIIVLDIERPLALRIALSRGLTSGATFRDNSEGEWERGREIPERVVASGFDYVLLSNLIINSEERVVENEKEIDSLFRFYIEKGLEVIQYELNTLPPTDNYLLYLINTVNSAENGMDPTEAILKLLKL